MSESESFNNGSGLGWFQKIRNRIVFTVIIAAVLPLMLISGSIAFKVRKDLVEQTVLTQKQRTQTIQHGIQTLFKSYFKQMENLAKIPEIQGMKAEEQIKPIHEFLEQQKIFLSCSVYTDELSIVSVALRNRKDQIDYAPEDFSSGPDEVSKMKKAFDKVVASGEPAFLTHYLPVLDEQRLFVFVPVFDFVNSQKVVGLISCSISLLAPDIHEIICDYPIKNDDILVLTDRQGGLVSWQGNIGENFSGLFIPQNWNNDLKSRAVRVKIASASYLGTVSPLPVMDGYLLAARPWNKALGFLNQLLLDLALVFAVAIVIAVSAGFFMSRSLAEGIELLVKGIREVSRGVLSHRVEVSGKDELAEAGRAFNEMVDSLEKHRIIDQVWNKEWNEKTGRDDND
jgi:HAMP domain-containing protein